MVKYYRYICYHQYMQIFTSFTSDVEKLLKKGAVGVIPTDTVYGVVGSLLSSDTVARIYAVKARGPEKPVGTILIGDTSQIYDMVDPELLKKAQQYWPGAVSVVLPVSDELSYAHKGFNSLPFTLPDNIKIQNLVSATGPLAISSANPASLQPSNTIEEAIKYFSDSVDFYVDGGDLSYSKPSKIIRFDEQGNEEIIRG